MYLAHGSHVFSVVRLVEVAAVELVETELAEALRESNRTEATSRERSTDAALELSGIS